MSNNDGNIVKRTSQYIDNISFDETTNLPMVEIAGTDGTNVYRAKVNSDGALLSAAGLVTATFDYISASYPDAVTETYTYKTGGAGGVTVSTVTVVYTDSTKANVSSVART